MEDIQKEDLVKFLQQHMTIDLDENYDWGSKGIRVTIWIDNVEICSGSMRLSSCHDTY